MEEHTSRVFKHYCQTHRSSDGYIDPEGEWKCWQCYKEDRYMTPIGDVIMHKTIGNREIRAVVLPSKHQIVIEQWKLMKTVNLLEDESRYEYLTQATRRYKELVESLGE